MALTEILKTDGFLFTETSIALNVLQADFGDGYKAGALVGSPFGLRSWSIKIDALPDNFTMGAGPVTGTEATRAAYLWDLFIESKAAGNAPFWFEDPKDGKFYLVEFADEALTYQILCAEIYSTGVQLRQRRAPGTATTPTLKSGLIYRDAFTTLDGWTNGGNFSIDATLPTVVAQATSHSSVSFGGIPGSFDAVGAREGGILRDGDEWLMWYDSGNGQPGTPGYVWRQFLASSRDRGRTWTHEGPLSIGLQKTSNPADGEWASRACGWIEKRGGVYYLNSLYATALDPGGEFPAGSYYADVWSGPTARGPWTWIRQHLTPGGPGAFDERYAYGASVIFSGGLYYLFYGAFAETAAAANIGIASGPGPAGPWTKLGSTGILPDLIKGQPENPKVFWHPTLGRWLMLVNQMTPTFSKTDRNSCYVSASLTNWTSATRWDIQGIFPIDCLPSGNIIGMATPVCDAEAAPVFDAAGNLAITFDGDTTDGPPQHHHGRHEKYATLEPAPTALYYNALDTTDRLLSRTLAHSDFVAEFTVTGVEFGAGGGILFEFRLDSATGLTGLRLVVPLDNDSGLGKLQLEQRTGGTWTRIQSGTGVITTVTSFVYQQRIRVVAQGAKIKAYVQGEKQIDFNAAAHLSGNAIAFRGFNVKAHVRLLKIYQAETVTIANVGPGDPIVLRGPLGTPVKQVANGLPGVNTIVYESFPQGSVQIADNELAVPALNQARADEGGSASASSIFGAEYAADFALNGSRVGSNDNRDYWTSANTTPPHTLTIDLGQLRAIELINVFTCQTDPFNWLPPTRTMTFTQFGATAFYLEYFDGSSWRAYPGGTVTGNNLVWRQFTGAVLLMSKLRVVITASSDNVGRLVEVEALSPSGIWGGSVLDAGRIARTGRSEIAL